MTVAPCQNQAAREAVGVAKEQCAQAAWAVEPGGATYRGAGAINAALSCALQTRMFLVIYRLPLLEWIQDRAYDFIARVRGDLPGVEPHCHRWPESCE